MTTGGSPHRLATRSLLVGSSLVTIGAFAGMIAISGAVRSGAVADDWLGALGLGMTAATICAVVVSFIHAARNDRSGPAWAVGSLLFPYVTPLILALLPASGRVAVHGAEQAGDLRPLLIGKWICPCGVIHSDARDGDTCNDCGKPLLRFHAAELGQSCSECHFRFSDVDITTEDTMREVWARKGFRCNACGENLCLSCLPTNADGDTEYRCRCGGTVAIRI